MKHNREMCECDDCSNAKAFNDMRDEAEHQDHISLVRKLIDDSHLMLGRLDAIGHVYISIAEMMPSGKPFDVLFTRVATEAMRVDRLHRIVQKSILSAEKVLLKLSHGRDAHAT